MAALLALASSLLWGGADFLGGHQARRWGVLRVLAWSQVVALVLLWIAIGVGVAGFGLQPTARGVMIGMAGGAAGVVGLAAFYRALAVGPMTVVPPIAAAGVALPVGVGLARGATPTASVFGGLALAVVGVVLASAGTAPADVDGVRRRIAPSTLGLCVVAACGFALVFIALDAAAGSSPGGALVATGGVRVGSVAVIAVALLLARAGVVHGVGPRVAVTFGAIGILDTGANLLFAIAAALGRLEVVAVLASLYPAVTSVLAHLLLGERVGRVQLLGIVLALAGVVLLSGR